MLSLQKGQLSFSKYQKTWIVQERNKTRFALLHDLFLSSLTFVSSSFCLISLFCRARIETRSSISDQNLQCSQGICETVTNPYSLDDYMRMKEGNGGGFRWEQTHSKPEPTAFSLPHDLCSLNTFNYAAEESDFLKVHYKNPPSLSQVGQLFYWGGV